MLTKCPICGKSDKVTSLNGFRSVVATISEVATVMILGKNGQVVAKNLSKKICPENKPYCSRCKYEF